MNASALALLVLTLEPAAAPAEPPPALIVYLVGSGVIPLEVLPAAKATANRMFEAAGVRLEWRKGQPSHTSAEQPVVITFRSGTPYNLLPGALARSQPFEGVHVTIFYDRVALWSGPTAVLAHVMVHEITHMVQGTDWHSREGDMKAVWTDADYSRMYYKPLPFTAYDVTLIHAGLAARARQRALASTLP